MKIILRLFLLATLLTLTTRAHATPGQYAFNFKLGPSFEVSDHDNAFKLGGEFDYELGFGFGFNLASYAGISESFLFQLISSIKYDVVYFVPGSLFIQAGAGYEAYDFEENAMVMRFGTGLRLPLRKPLEFLTDVNFFVTPSGVPGTPVTFDWLTGFGFRY